MKRKYKKRKDSDIYEDYWYYLGKEHIYTVVFGHRPKGYRKADYIWNSLLKEYGKVKENR